MFFPQHFAAHSSYLDTDSEISTTTNTNIVAGKANNIGETFVDSEDLESSLQIMEESLDVGREGGDAGNATILPIKKRVDGYHPLSAAEESKLKTLVLNGQKPIIVASNNNNSNNSSSCGGSQDTIANLENNGFRQHESSEADIDASLAAIAAETEAEVAAGAAAVKSMDRQIRVEAAMASGGLQGADERRAKIEQGRMSAAAIEVSKNHREQAMIAALAAKDAEILRLKKDQEANEAMAKRVLDQSLEEKRKMGVAIGRQMVRAERQASQEMTSMVPLVQHQFQPQPQLQQFHFQQQEGGRGMEFGALNAKSYTVSRPAGPEYRTPQVTPQGTPTSQGGLQRQQLNIMLPQHPVNLATHYARGTSTPLNNSSSAPGSDGFTFPPPPPRQLQQQQSESSPNIPKVVDMGPVSVVDFSSRLNRPTRKRCFLGNGFFIQMRRLELPARQSTGGVGEGPRQWDSLAIGKESVDVHGTPREFVLNLARSQIPAIRKSLDFIEDPANDVWEGADDQLKKQNNYNAPSAAPSPIFFAEDHHGEDMGAIGYAGMAKRTR